MIVANFLNTALLDKNSSKKKNERSFFTLVIMIQVDCEKQR